MRGRCWGALLGALCALLAMALAACTSKGAEPDASTRTEADAGAPLGDASPAKDAHPGEDAADAAKEPIPSLLLFTLANAPFPDAGHPDVAVHVPPGFDPTDHPGLIVFFHGFENCVANVVGDVDTECTPGAGARTGLHLIEQLDAAKVNAILVAVECEYDVASGNPGQLTKEGRFRDLLHELLTEHLDPLLGVPLDVPDFAPIVVGSHSGGYEVTAAVLTYGQVPEIREIDLYDSLYGYIATFEEWITKNADRFAKGATDGLRWMDVYTTSGGTDANSQNMAVDVKPALEDVGVGAAFVDDQTFDTLDDATYEATTVLFKLSSLSHEGVPQYYFQEMAEHAGFTPLP